MTIEGSDIGVKGNENTESMLSIDLAVESKSKKK